MVKKKVGIRYCGGCNPTYERTELIERVRSQTEDQFLFVQYDEQGVDVLVSVNGCLRACASDILNPSEIPHFPTTKEGDFGNLMRWLVDLSKK